MAKLLGFGEPVVATVQQMQEAIMLGKFIHRDEDAAYYQYQGHLYVLQKEQPRPSRQQEK